MTTRYIKSGFYLTLLFIVIGSGLARANQGIYVGAGASYAWSERTEFEETDLNLELGNSYGINARFGFRPRELFAFELNIDHMPSFDRTKGFTIDDIPLDVKGELSLTTLMVDAKLFPFRSESVDFRLFGGFGVMWANLKVDTSKRVFDGLFEVSFDDALPCGEIGLGFGVRLNRFVSLDLEGSYVASLNGFADQDYTIGYALATVGLNYHF